MFRLRVVILLLLMLVPALAQAPDRTFAREGQPEGTLNFSANGRFFVWQARQTIVPQPRQLRISNTRGSGDLALRIEVGRVVSAPPEQGGEAFLVEESWTLGSEAARALRDGLGQTFPVAASSISSGPR